MSQSNISIVERGRDFIVSDIHRWIAAEMVRLELRTNGEPQIGSPVVFLEQFYTNPLFGYKNSNEYEVSFYCDIVSRSESKTEVYNVAEKIMQKIRFESKLFVFQSHKINILAGSEEYDDNGRLQRQILEFNLKIIK